MAVVALSPSDDGRTVTVDVGDDVVVRLPESPTTGYRWEIVRADPPLTVADDAFELGAEPRIGSGGERLITIRADRPGTGRIELKHWQAWEGEASVTDRVAFTVAVGGGEDL